MSNNTKDERRILLHRAILNELGCNINYEPLILDFGCGDGRTVCQYRNAGFKAFGVAIKLKEETEFLRVIHENDRYRIPFDDETFDFIFSEEVFEHISNYPLVLSEILRVLKPNGFSLHFFLLNIVSLSLIFLFHSLDQFKTTIG
jgi:SAM-dependent methyltransferase